MYYLYVLSLIALFSVRSMGQDAPLLLGMQEAVTMGLKNNPEIQIAREKINAESGKYWSGISLPKAEFGLSYEYIPDGKSIGSYSEKTMSFSQSFEFPTNYIFKSRLLTTSALIAAQKLEMAKRQLVFRIKSSYCKVLLKQYQKQYAGDYLVISQDFLDKAIIRTNLGEGTHLEKLTATVQLAEAQNNLEMVENDLKTAHLELQKMLTDANGGHLQQYVLSDSLLFSSNIKHPDIIFSSYEENNPRVIIAKLNYELTDAEKNLAWSSALPEMNFSYFKQSRDGGSGFYGASFGISIPLWFMFEQKGKIQESSANHSASAQEIISARNEIAVALTSAVNEHQNNTKLAALYRNTLLPQSEEMYRTALKSYAEGELSYLEYLQAKQILITSRNNYISALYNYYVSAFKIEEITGLNIHEQMKLEK